MKSLPFVLLVLLLIAGLGIWLFLRREAAREEATARPTVPVPSQSPSADQRPSPERESAPGDEPTEDGTGSAPMFIPVRESASVIISGETNLGEAGRLVSSLAEAGWGKWELAASASAVRDRMAEESAGQTLIVVGNMADNPLLYELYRKSLAFVDLRYPGEGGYVLRTLRNPLGDGRDVVLCGASDATGLAAGVDALIAMARSRPEPGFPWLMETRLGAGVEPPKPGVLPVLSWRDSYRKTPVTLHGSVMGRYFGWSPVTQAGAMYAMTGDPAWLAKFKELAMPADPKNLPRELTGDGEAFENPADPLVTVYHYRGQYFPALWRQIQDSPGFTDAERAFVDGKMRLWVKHYDPEGDFSRKVLERARAWESQPTRHDCYHMLCIYAASSYLAEKYPDESEWRTRVADVRAAFAWFLTQPTWGESDSLDWVNTSIQPVFDFFAWDGYGEFVESGAARRLLEPLFVLWSGKPDEFSNEFQSIELLHRAAWMLRDGRYSWLARRPSYDWDSFRLGQSWWPDTALAPKPPDDLLRGVSVAPLAEFDWRQTSRQVPLTEGFQAASYRTTLDDGGDFFLIDGFFGSGRNPYHVNALKLLRVGGGRLLDGYENQVVVRRGGLVESQVPKAAALRSAQVFPGGVHVRTDVPDMAFSSWQRHILLFDKKLSVVFDRVVARDDAALEVQSRWNLAGEGPATLENGLVQKGHAALRWAMGGLQSEPAGKIAEGTFQPSQAGYLSAVVLASAETLPSVVSRAIAPNAVHLTGPVEGTLFAGTLATRTLRGEAEFCWVSSGEVVASGLRKLSLGDFGIEASTAVDLSWSSENGELVIRAAEAGTLSVRLAGGKKETIEITQGESTHSLDFPAKLADSLAALPAISPGGRDSVGRPADVRTSNLPQPRRLWTRKLEGKPVLMAAGNDGRVAVGTESGQVVCLSPAGQVLWVAETGFRPTVFHWTNPDELSGIALLVGTADSGIHALGKDGKLLWRAKGNTNPVFAVGKTWFAGWFTDPVKRAGTLSFLPVPFGPDASPLIAVGLRASTVEFRDPKDGRLVRSVPSRWGDNQSLALLRRPDQPPLLLAGKSFTGQAGLTMIDSSFRVLEEMGFRGTADGTTLMRGGWMQQGASHLLTLPLDPSGNDMVLVLRNGFWNELSAYTADQYCRWVVSFGPADFKTPITPDDWTMRSLLVVGDSLENLRILAAQRTGAVTALNWRGGVVWTHRAPGGIESMVAPVDGKFLAIIPRDVGRLQILNPAGKITSELPLPQKVAAAAVSSPGRLLLGFETGEIAAYQP